MSGLHWDTLERLHPVHVIERRFRRWEEALAKAFQASCPGDRPQHFRGTINLLRAWLDLGFRIPESDVDELSGYLSNLANPVFFAFSTDAGSVSVPNALTLYLPRDGVSAILERVSAVVDRATQVSIELDEQIGERFPSDEEVDAAYVAWESANDLWVYLVNVFHELNPRSPRIPIEPVTDTLGITFNEVPLCYGARESEEDSRPDQRAQREPTAAAKERKPRFADKQQEAEEMSVFSADYPESKIREWADHFGRSQGYICGTEAWEKHMEVHGRRRGRPRSRSSSVKAERLTDAHLASHGELDESLERIIDDDT